VANADFWQVTFGSSIQILATVLSPFTIAGEGIREAAQYLLLSAKLIRQHHQRGQKLGCGFASSRNCLYREINRGVDWIFTNHALRLEAIRRRASRKG
jgi:hypothetical protein